MIDAWAQAGVFGSAERHGADVLCRADDSGDELLPLAAALALWAPLHGHACVDLSTVRDTVLHEVAAASRTGDTAALEAVEALSWPTFDQWLDSLTRSPVCRVVSAADVDAGHEPLFDDHPLVLHGTLLCTQRQWVDECIVSADLRQRASAPRAALHKTTVSLLDELFPDGGRQRDAAVLGATSRLAVIVGGPGTGKTHTIARLLIVLQHQAQQVGAPLRVALAAPTGKAAARMADALAAAEPRHSHDARDSGEADHPHANAVHPTTVHRLLGARWQETRFAYGPDRPLEVDVVIVDEASMVALPLMARLVEALRPSTRLVLVGDPDQLESIEVGAVLADIVTAAEAPASPLGTSVIRLDRPHRQAAGSPIGPLAEAIRLGRDDEVMDILGSDVAGVRFVDTAPFGLAGSEQAVREAVLPSLRTAAESAKNGDAQGALEALAAVRVLCAHRTGPYGVQRWNRMIESWLGSDDRAGGGAGGGRAGGRAGGGAGGGVGGIGGVGRPLLATRNDPRLRVANGDTGIIVNTPAGTRAAFGTAGGIRLLSAAQLDAVETAYAMTVHKSQGSEYATVVLVLPPATSPLIGRELLYTAVTRTSNELLVVGDEGAVRACVRSPGRRITGLAAALGRPTV